MCRWLAYHGGPIIVERALYSPAHSLIDQSLHSRLGAEATNGDGFGSAGMTTAPPRGCSGASNLPGTTPISGS
jgi:predicted glutamine amidotransferase